MAHIVIIPSGLAGRINLSLALRRRLEDVGHRVTIASPDDIGARVVPHGARTVHLQTDRGRRRVENPQARGKTGRTRRAIRRLDQLRSMKSRRDAAVDAIDPNGLVALLDGLHPDLVLIDVELSEQIVAVASAAPSLVLWTSMMSVWKRPGIPPLHTNIIPGSGWRGSSLGIEWAWTKFRAAKWLGNLRGRVDRVGTDRLSVLRTLASETGFPFEDEAVVYDWLIPFTFRSLPVLSFNASEMEFPHAPPPNCRYVGPMLRSGLTSATRVSDEVRARLSHLYARRRNEDGRSLIYCAFGETYRGDDSGFIRRVAVAVEPHIEWDVIVSLGGRLETDVLDDVPANVHLFRWAPQMEILDHVDVAVHHAGISSLNECVAAGVPMVLYPFPILDEPGNAARAAYHRLGEVGDRETETPVVIRERIDRVLNDRDIRSRVERMARVLARYEQEDRAVAAIESFL